MHATEVFCQPCSAHVARTPINIFNSTVTVGDDVIADSVSLLDVGSRKQDGPYLLNVAIIVLYLSPTTATTAAAQSGSTGCAVMTKVNHPY